MTDLERRLNEYVKSRSIDDKDKNMITTEYVEVTEPFNTEYPTWIIAFCPDTDTFFGTNQRHFFWEHDKEFDTEREAVDYFESHVNEFCNIEERIMNGIRGGWCDKVFLENTNKWYERQTPKADEFRRIALSSPRPNYGYKQPKHNPIKPIEYPDSERGFLRHSECKSNIIGKDNDKMTTIFCYDAF